MAKIPTHPDKEQLNCSDDSFLNKSPEKVVRFCFFKYNVPDLVFFNVITGIA